MNYLLTKCLFIFLGYDGVDAVWEPMCQLVLEKLGLQRDEKYNEPGDELEERGDTNPLKISYCPNCSISFENLTDICGNCAKRTLTLAGQLSSEVIKATAATSHNSDTCTEDSGIDMSEECDKSISKQGSGALKCARKQYTKKSIASSANTTGKLICR